MVRRVTSFAPYTVSEAEFTRLRAQHTCVMNSDQEQEEDMDDQDDGHSPINLRISTALRIHGDSNAILMSTAPVDHAKAVAQTVVSAIRQCSDVNGGLPMIDEEGRPRPVNISVDAGLSIKGSGNILGNEEHVLQSLCGAKCGGGGKRKRDDGDGLDRRRRRTRGSSM